MKHAAFTALASLLIAAAPALAAETHDVTPKSSKITFKIQNKPPGATEFTEVPGSFKEFSGKLVVDKADPAKCSVEIEVKTASVDTANKKRDDHLRNQDFFKVKEHPKMSFKSSKVTKDGDKYKVEGQFTLLGVSKTITVDFAPSGDSGGKVSFQIKRSDFGMNYRVPDTADEVDVTLEISGE